MKRLLATTAALAIAAGVNAAAAGASILDLGAESTRPGHTPVPAAQQCRHGLRFVLDHYASMPADRSMPMSRPREESRARIAREVRSARDRDRGIAVRAMNGISARSVREYRSAADHRARARAAGSREDDPAAGLLARGLAAEAGGSKADPSAAEAALQNAAGKLKRDTTARLR